MHVKLSNYIHKYMKILVNFSFLRISYIIYNEKWPHLSTICPPTPFIYPPHIASQRHVFFHDPLTQLVLPNKELFSLPQWPPTFKCSSDGVRPTNHLPNLCQIFGWLNLVQIAIAPVRSWLRHPWHVQKTAFYRTPSHPPCVSPPSILHSTFWYFWTLFSREDIPQSFWDWFLSVLQPK